MPQPKRDIPYRVELYDTAGLRVAAFDSVPLMDVIRATPDQRGRIEGLFPEGLTDLGIGYTVRVYVDNAFFCEAPITRIQPQWGDTQKLILDRYVTFREAIAFEAETEALIGNTTVTAAYANRTVTQIVTDAINRALGPIHYTIDHTVYPAGATHEYQKFTARQSTDGPLEIGGIAVGSWADSSRIDLSAAYAKDGDTIAGIKVDAIAWPDLRMMLIDTEESSLNSHAKKMHPEIVNWTTAQYDASGYKLRADAATQFLQDLIDTKGIDYIELNPHKDSTGAYDDRIDAYGRYLGFVYGGGECFNAAQVENGHAEILLYNDGAYHVPEMALKEYYSYTGPATDSIEDATVGLVSFAVDNGLFEILTTLACAAGGYIWSVSPDLAVTFRQADRAGRVVFFDPTEHSVTLGSRNDRLTNILYFDGNLFTGSFEKTYYNGDSIDAYGVHYRFLDLYSVHLEEDADKIVAGLLDDLAYPEPSGEIRFLNGDPSLHVGDIIELRGPNLRRLEREINGEWGDRFTGKLAGRIRRVKHRFQGRHVITTASLTSPLRSVEDPLRFMTRGQPSAQSLFQFRLDDATVGLDSGFHLD